MIEARVVIYYYATTANHSREGAYPTQQEMISIDPLEVFAGVNEACQEIQLYATMANHSRHGVSKTQQAMITTDVTTQEVFASEWNMRSDQTLPGRYG